MTRSNWPGPWPDDPWASFDELRRGMDALFGRRGAGVAFQAAPGAYPPVNLYESEDGYVLTAELPGVRSEDVEVMLEGHRLVLRGERRIEIPKDDRTSIHRLERPSGRFRRAFELPADVDAEKVEAVHRHGVLVLRLPRSAAARPRQVAVQTG